MVERWQKEEIMECGGGMLEIYYCESFVSSGFYKHEQTDTPHIARIFLVI